MELTPIQKTVRDDLGKFVSQAELRDFLVALEDWYGTEQLKEGIEEYFEEKEQL